MVAWTGRSPILQGSPSSPWVVQGTLRQGWQCHSDVSPTQVRTCANTETSLQGLGSLTRLLPHLPGLPCSPALPSLTPPRSTCLLWNKGVSFRQTLHPPLQAAEEELNVTGSNPGWPAAHWARGAASHWPGLMRRCAGAPPPPPLLRGGGHGASWTMACGSCLQGALSRLPR